MQDDVARVKELDLRGALESPATDLRYFGEALDHLPIITTVKDLIDQLQHINLVPLQEVIDIRAQQLLETGEAVEVGDRDDVPILTRGWRLNLLLNQLQYAIHIS